MLGAGDVLSYLEDRIATCSTSAVLFECLPVISYGQGFNVNGSCRAECWKLQRCNECLREGRLVLKPSLVCIQGLHLSLAL